MRLYHVSEEAGIQLFEPRTPTRSDLDSGTPLVWAIDELRLPNYLTPRDCPRVCFHAGPETTPEDRTRFFSSRSCQHAVAVEHAWFEKLLSTALYLYEFDPAGFRLEDEVAGYYVSTRAETPLGVTRVSNLPLALFERNAELRVTDRLWDLADAVRASTLRWSLCRMRNARSREAFFGENFRLH